MLSRIQREADCCRLIETMIDLLTGSAALYLLFEGEGSGLLKSAHKLMDGFLFWKKFRADTDGFCICSLFIVVDFK